MSRLRTFAAFTNGPSLALLGVLLPMVDAFNAVGCPASLYACCTVGRVRQVLCAPWNCCRHGSRWTNQSLPTDQEWGPPFSFLNNQNLPLSIGEVRIRRDSLMTTNFLAFFLMGFTGAIIVRASTTVRNVKPYPSVLSCILVVSKLGKDCLSPARIAPKRIARKRYAK